MYAESQNRNEKAEDHVAASLNRQEGLRPKWTQEEAIAFACARDYLAELQAVYATALDELVSQPTADVNREAWLRGELAMLQRQRRHLMVRDQAAIADIRVTFRMRLDAARPQPKV
jgi:hypothetical protein